jgi:hypothetical protein
MVIIWGIIALFTVTGIYSIVYFMRVLFGKGRQRVNLFLRTAEIIGIVLAPVIFLTFFDAKANNCCDDTAFFSPGHRLTIYVIILLSVIAYFSSSYRSSTAPPLLEVLINCFLIAGIILSVFVALHMKSDDTLWLLGVPAVFFFFLSRLIKNHRQLLAELAEMDWRKMHPVNQACLTLLQANVFLKFPLLLILTLPVLILLSLVLYVFGQRPDSVIRAFTETYRNRFSQWDYQCENVHCGGHYLCSVAANGHKEVVNPVRIGKRNGHYILCNRQLLISNAFEELLQEKFPTLHRGIRRQYDKVGDMVHRNYNIYSKKWVSDLVYVIMKPAEWSFLLLLYLVDRKPEQRIARQYAPWD